MEDAAHSHYRDHKIIAMPPPTSGGIATIEILNLLEGFPVGSTTGDVTDTQVKGGRIEIIKSGYGPEP